MDGHKPIFICDIQNCEKIFTTKYSLARHMQTHRKKKAFKCKECDKTFSIKQNLIEHEFVHTGELPYVCNFEGCSERFRQRGKLALHRQTHKNYSKKAYRSHNKINDGEIKNTREGSLNVLVNSANVRPSMVSTSIVPSQMPSSTNYYVINNPCNKISQFPCNQSMVGFGQTLPIRSGVVGSNQVVPINLVRRPLMTQSGNSGVLPKLSLLMLPNNNFRCPLN